MQTHSVLVRLPSYPFAVEDLCPDLDLASMAAILTQADHATQVLDYGTVETFERLFPNEVRALMRRLSAVPYADAPSEWTAPISMRWKLRRISKNVRQHHDRVCREIAGEIAALGKLDFVLIKGAGPNDLQSFLTLSRSLRALRPGTVQIAFMPDPAPWEDAALKAASAVDCIYFGRTSHSIAQWAGCVRESGLWQGIPHIAPCREGQVGGFREYAGEEAEGLPAPLYGPQAYPALYDSTKIRLFTVSEARHGSGASPFARPAAALADELLGLRDDHRARAFHFGAPATEGDSAGALAKELLKRGLYLCYSRDVDIATFDPSQVPLLKASGCRALSFRIDTGSQRLLDTYYEHPFCVSEVERALRATRFSGIHTIASFTYPTVEDDYHTRAETVRLIERTRPHAVTVMLPLSDTGQRGALSRAARAEAQALNRTPRKSVMREYLGLKTEIEELGMSTAMTPQRALMAGLSGYGEREGDFCDQLRYQFATGDAMGIGTLVDLFNRGGPVPADAVLLRPFVASQNAVGN